MANTVLNCDLSEPLNDASAARIEIDCGTGHLSVNELGPDDHFLAKGSLQYYENQGVPSCSLEYSGGNADLTLKAADRKKTGFRFPWATCGGSYDWRVLLNPAVSSDLSVLSRGGNVKLKLNRMAVRHLSAETVGGNVDVVLPDESADLAAAVKTGGGNVNLEVGSKIRGTATTIAAKSRAGNVTVHVPNGVAARIHASTGVGKVIVDPVFGSIDKNKYQSADYESAAVKLEITAHSGAGNVIVSTR